MGCTTHYSKNKYQQKYKKILFSAHIYFGKTEIQKNKITVTGTTCSKGFIFITYSLVFKDFYSHKFNTPYHINMTEIIN